MRVQEFLLSALLMGSSALAAQLNERFIDNTNALTKRQQFRPTTTTAEGSTCADAFGQGYTTCREATGDKNRLCYNPTLGQTCCNNSWACPNGAFCLVSESCCPTGTSPQACASENGVSVSSGFLAPTASGTGAGSKSTGDAKKSSSNSGRSPNMMNMAGLAGAVFGAAALL